MVLEINHRVSKTCSESFWKLANDFFPLLYEAKKAQMIRKKVPQFQSIRNNLHIENVPEIKMKVAFENKITGEIETLTDLKSIPRYSPQTYKKLYEMATVEVNQKS